MDDHTREAIRRAKLVGEMLCLNGSPTTSIDKEDLVNIGRDFWEFSYKGAKSDDDAMLNLDRHIHAMLVTNPSKGTEMLALMQLPDFNMIKMSAARWVDQGLPIFKLSHKRAAALMATSVPVSMADDVRPPFKAFYIEMPSDLIKVEEEGEYRPVKGILVQSCVPTGAYKGMATDLIGKRLWNWRAITGTYLSQWQQYQTMDNLLDENYDHLDREAWKDAAAVSHARLYDIGPYDEKVSLLINRLIASLCLSLSSPGTFVEKLSKKDKKPKKGKKKDKKAPNYRVFIESSPVTVDVRPAIQSFLYGKRGSAPSVNFLVRGHWRSQPHGPDRALRRPQWIEPFWKGPEGTAIARKDHKVG